MTQECMIDNYLTQSGTDDHDMNKYRHNVFKGAGEGHDQ